MAGPSTGTTCLRWTSSRSRFQKSSVGGEIVNIWEADDHELNEDCPTSCGPGRLVSTARLGAGSTGRHVTLCGPIAWGAPLPTKSVHAVAVGYTPHSSAPVIPSECV